MKPPIGRIQLMIWRAFIANGGGLLTTGDLARWSYPRRKAIAHNQRRAVRRAALAIAEPVGRSKKGKGRPILWRVKQPPAVCGKSPADLASQNP